MTKPTQRSPEASDRTATMTESADRDVDRSGVSATQRKPYQRPLVKKRRSIREATLFSGDGQSGSLAGGSP